MEALGHPILGDSWYGNEESRAAADRLCLHATALKFEHPVSGKLVSFHQWDAGFPEVKLTDA